MTNFNVNSSVSHVFEIMLTPKEKHLVPDALESIRLAVAKHLDIPSSDVYLKEEYLKNGWAVLSRKDECGCLGRFDPIQYYPDFNSICITFRIEYPYKYSTRAKLVSQL